MTISMCSKPEFSVLLLHLIPTSLLIHEGLGFHLEWRPEDWSRPPEFSSSGVRTWRRRLGAER